MLEARKAFCLGRLDEAFAGYAIAETAYNAASAAEDDAVTAICAHRCATLEEVAIKGQYLLRKAGCGKSARPVSGFADQGRNPDGAL